MANPLRLFTSPSAFPNPQRVRLFMLEKGIEANIEETIYDMAPGGEQRKWPHLKMHPWGETPTLTLEDGSYLAETAAIIRYLDQPYPGQKINGRECHRAGLGHHVGESYLDPRAVPHRDDVPCDATRAGAQA